MISVIVCVYNGQKTLKKCVDSILAQTYRNLEIILIDDGSVDNTPEICDGYAKIDSRVRVFHQSNSGVSTARNTGLEKASCELLTFVDADDWIGPEYYEGIMKATCNMLSIDVAISGFNRVFPGEKEANIRLNNGLVKFTEPAAEYWKKYEDNQLSMGVTWNKIYRMSIISANKLTFSDKVAVMGDIIFNLLYFSFCKNMYLIDYSPYHYIYYSDSIMNIVSINSISKKMGFYIELQKVWELTGIPEEKTLFFRKFMSDILEINIFIMASRKEYKIMERVKIVKKMVGESTFREFYLNEPRKGLYNNFKFLFIRLNCPLLIIAFAVLKKHLKQ